MGLTIATSDIAGGARLSTALLEGAVAVNPFPVDVPARISFDVPPTVPRAQRYFWTRIWQEFEKEADEDVRHGRVRRFDDPLDAVRWLLDESDDDA